MTASVHPFDPLTPGEISKAAAIVCAHFPGQTPAFRFITLKEPLKSEMLPFLEKEHLGLPATTRPARIARVQVVLRDGEGANKLIELLVDLGRQEMTQDEHLVGKHSHVDPDYMVLAEKACLADARVQEEIKKLKLPENATVIVEPWTYATDGMNDMSQRVTQCWFYMRLLDHPDANYYAYPLHLCAEVSEQLTVTKVYYLPSSENERISEQVQPFDHNRIHSTAESEYHPSLRPPPRNTTKPYQVVQPEGPSFSVNGNHLSWEKWTMRVGFNYREGLTLHDVRYDGRSVFYRLSLAEMFVPYGDPRTPYPRKAAFDLGNDGAGVNANNLRLGCDCLGLIKYFDGWHSTSSGEPLKLPNVVCCHEQDDGILWKHTNFRTQNAVVTRSRILVLQTIITVSNYEYIFAFHFGQDASIHYEVRATGILSTCPINLGDKVPYGTVVAPGVLAPYHQHLFCLRMDPAIDGNSNSLQVEESHPMPVNDPSTHNPFSVGYTTTSTIITNEAGLDLDFTKNRTFKIINEAQINPITGTPVGFKLHPSYSQLLLAHPDSYHAQRSEYTTHAVWVTRYDDDELFPSGRYTMQSSGGDGIHSGILRRRNDPASNTSVRNEDIVVWHTFGSTHNPRIEDWPVMPSEKMTVGLKPVNFFTGNPGLDVAVSTQERNRSVLVGGESLQASSDACCRL
ncbi:copper amine oxidase [Aspergillus egyptiacus]|nr:copper amine oxidase [Aspergillus egyptiacus]